MANVDNPHGLRPLMRNLDGGEPQIRQLAKAVGYGTAIFEFDAINRVADGSIEASATPGTTNYTGVALNYGALSTATNHQCIVSPSAVYEAQDNGGAGVLAVDLGNNANLVLTAGNTTTLLSKHQIATSTLTTTVTLDVHLLALLDVPDNIHGANARIEIVFNKHRLAPATVGV